MTERRTNGEARDRIEEIREDYHELAATNRRRHDRLARNTYLILGLMFVVQFALGIWSISLSSRTGKSEENSRRIDRAVCAEVHYLERGLTFTENNPDQSIVHDELKRVIDQLRPETTNCPPAPPLVLPEGPGAGSGVWENPPTPGG